jgi:hypothetical protein
MYSVERSCSNTRVSPPASPGTRPAMQTREQLCCDAGSLGAAASESAAKDAQPKRSIKVSSSYLHPRRLRPSWQPRAEPKLNAVRLFPSGDLGKLASCRAWVDTRQGRCALRFCCSSACSSGGPTVSRTMLAPDAALATLWTLRSRG